MTTRYAFSIDLDRCIGCQACAIACQTGNEIPLGDSFIAVSDIVRGQSPDFFGSFAHHRCFHCGDAACVSVCPTGALSKWNGLTIVDTDKCSACGYCTDACPYQIPHITDNHVSKCIACLDLVTDGQTPWCAQTCPSGAIKFGDRAQLLADAQARVGAIKARYPNAQVYGDTQLGGLGLMMILLDQPAVYGLPANPEITLPLAAWQKVVQPASVGLTLTAVAVTGLSFIIARRQHLREKMEGSAPGTGAGVLSAGAAATALKPAGPAAAETEGKEKKHNG